MNKADRDPERFIELLEVVKNEPSSLIKFKNCDSPLGKDAVCIQDFFPLGDLSYYSAVHIKILKLMTMIIQNPDKQNLDRLLVSLYDAINYLSFWAADIKLRIEQRDKESNELDMEG